MAKRDIQPGIDEEIDAEMLPADVDSELEEQDEADEIALANALSELGESGGSGKVVVHKEDASKRDVYINTYDIAVFNEIGLNGLRSEFGAGTYRIRVYNGKGRLVKGGNKKITMAQIERERPKETAPDQTAMLASVLEAMQRNMEQNFMRLAEALRPPPAPTRQEMLTEMMMMKQVFGGEQRQDNNMDVFLKALETARTLMPPSGDASGADVFMEMVRQFGPVIAQNARSLPPQPQRVQKPQPISPPVPVNLPERGISPAAPTPEIATQIQPAQEDDMGAMFKLQLKMLVSAARLGSPPENYVDMILDHFDDETLNEFLGDPQAIQKLAAIDQSVMSVAPWFEKLRDAINVALAEDTDDGLTIPPFPESNEEHE